MNHHTFVRAAGTIFIIIGFLHLLRVIYGWSAVINGWTVPMSLSYIVVLVTAYLSYQAWCIGKRS